MSKRFILLVLAAFLVAGSASAGEQKALPWLIKPVLIEAVRAQNADHKDLTPAQIAALDNRWRAERVSRDRPLIDGVMANKLSRFLKKIQESSNGLFTEIFVMDNRGLNVGQSEISNDYWQGDEAKWRKTFLVGAKARHVGEPEYVAATRKYQAQLSMPIVDPENGTVIGAMTLGVDVGVIEMLMGCSAFSGSCNNSQVGMAVDPAGHGIAAVSGRNTP